MKCLIDEQDLIYIDKKFKKEMEAFETIRESAAKSILKTETHTNMVQEWKSNIRAVLLDVRKTLIDWIDSFTNKFVKSLSKIDSSKDLVDLKNGETKLFSEMADIQANYLEIVKIFGSVAAAEPADKLNKIESFRNNMRLIEQ